MNQLTILIIGITGMFFLTACQKPRTAKFEVGEKVRVKLSETEGRVSLRMKLFREDQYWVRVSGSYYALQPVEYREAMMARDTFFESEFGISIAPKPWHDEGPFHESELEPANH
jgi:hypothetical protein